MGVGSLGAGIIMKWSGKYYYLMLAGVLLTFGSTALLVSWSPSTPSWRLWMDMFPAALGGAATVNATLIVS